MFTGPKMKSVFDTMNTFNHFTLHGRVNIRKWSQFTHYVNSTHNNYVNTTNKPKSVHVHNEIKIGDFLLLVVEEFIQRTANSFSHQKQMRRDMMKKSFIDMGSDNIIHKIMDNGQPPMLLLLS